MWYPPRFLYWNRLFRQQKLLAHKLVSRSRIWNWVGTVQQENREVTWKSMTKRARRSNLDLIATKDSLEHFVWWAEGITPSTSEEGRPKQRDEKFLRQRQSVDKLTWTGFKLKSYKSKWLYWRPSELGALVGKADFLFWMQRNNGIYGGTASQQTGHPDRASIWRVIGPNDEKI